MKDYRKLLTFFWEQERRLDCISLIIEITRLLNSLSVPQYYPSIFVHVTDILDIFGNLVYQRLLEKAKLERSANHLPSLSQNFVTSDILEHTRITARNWFGKVQDIKEALPRIYVELSLLKCMKFMDDSSTTANIMRIGSLIRSLQHPLISSYARAYLCRISIRIDATDRAPHWLCINDWMQTYKVQPIRLLFPALQYIVQCVSYGAVTYNDLLPLWEYCSVGNHRSILLCSFVNGISKFYLTEHAMEITKLVTDAEEVTAEELICLGKNICAVQVEERYRKQILRFAWKCINRIIQIPGFLASINIWIEFVAKYFSSRELGIILDQVLRQISPNKAYENHYPILISILEKIMSNSSNLIDLFELDIFVRFIDLFRKDTIKREISSIILTLFVQRTRRGALNNLKLAYFIIDICKKFHDSVTIYSTEDEVNTVAMLVQNALDKFQLDSIDPERSLEFLVSCRAATMNIDKIQKYIILRMLSLTLDITRRSKFSTAQTAFLQSCIANLFISIPSLLNPIHRIKLYIQSGHVAVAAQAFLFIDVFLQAAIKDFNSSSLTSSNDFCDLSPFFLSLLVTKPDTFNEKRTAFLKLIKRYLQAVEKFSWPSTQIASNQKGKCILFALQTQLFRRKLYDRITVASIQNEQFKWIDRNNREQNIEAIDEGILLTVNLLLPILENEKSELLPLNLELVEIVGKFGGDEIIEDLAEMAKNCYKKCKKIPKLKNRLLAVKKD
uniref:Uncharacterized protein n=1 Tax=Panagrolaimus superbus TaxID=310955 RepID=A0A914ZAJ8_9BILA